jgi:hypothetical protein
LPIGRPPTELAAGAAAAPVELWRRPAAGPRLGGVKYGTLQLVCSIMTEILALQFQHRRGDAAQAQCGGRPP